MCKFCDLYEEAIKNKKSLSKTSEEERYYMSLGNFCITDSGKIKLNGSDYNELELPFKYCPECSKKLQ